MRKFLKRLFKKREVSPSSCPVCHKLDCKLDEEAKRREAANKVKKGILVEIDSCGRENCPIC